MVRTEIRALGRRNTPAATCESTAAIIANDPAYFGDFPDSILNRRDAGTELGGTRMSLSPALRARAGPLQKYVRRRRRCGKTCVPGSFACIPVHVVSMNAPLMLIT
ncbi:hypothetical protein BDZ89DRAFT_1075650, partial [Hymenopellis radicata]